MSDSEFEQVQVVVELDKPLFNMITERLEKFELTWKDFIKSASVSKMNELREIEDDVE